MQSLQERYKAADEIVTQTMLLRNLTKEYLFHGQTTEAFEAKNAQERKVDSLIAKYRANGHRS